MTDSKPLSLAKNIFKRTIEKLVLGPISEEVDPSDHPELWPAYDHKVAEGINY